MRVRLQRLSRQEGVREQTQNQSGHQQKQLLQCTGLQASSNQNSDQMLLSCVKGGLFILPVSSLYLFNFCLPLCYIEIL